VERELQAQQSKVQDNKMANVSQLAVDVRVKNIASSSLASSQSDEKSGALLKITTYFQ